MDEIRRMLRRLSSIRDSLRALFCNTVGYGTSWSEQHRRVWQLPANAPSGDGRRSNVLSLPAAVSQLSKGKPELAPDVETANLRGGK